MPDSGISNLGLDQYPPGLVAGATAQPDMSWVGPTEKKLTDIGEAETKETGALGAARSKTLATDRDAVTAVKPQPTNVPNQPQKPEFDALQAFGSGASVFGLLASAFTHTPMINALKSSAAAMMAIHDGKIDNYNRAYKEWKDNADELFKKHAEQHEAYTDAMENMKTDYAQGTGALVAAAQKYGDQRTELLAKAGLWEKLGDMQRARQTSYEQMLRAYPDLVKGNAQIQLLDQGDKLAAMPDGPEKDKAKFEYQQRVSAAQIAGLIQTPPQVTPTMLKTQAIQAHMANGDDYATASSKVDAEVSLQKATASGMTGPDYDRAIYDGGYQWMMTGQFPNLSAFGGGSNQIKVEMMKAGNKIMDDLGVNMGQVIAMRGDQKATMGALLQVKKTQANVTSFEGTAEREADLVESLAPKGVAGKSPVFNRWIQAGRKSIEGDPDVSSLDTAITSFKNEYARIMSAPGASGGVTSDAARDEADRLINDAQSSDMLKANIKTMRKGMKNRLDSFDEEVGSLRKQMVDVAAPYRDDKGRAKALPSGLPSPKGVKEGARVKDEKGNVVAVLKDGQWTLPP